MWHPVRRSLGIGPGRAGHRRWGALLCVSLLLLGLGVGPAAWAGEQRYVTDEARIPLRVGKGTKYKIIRMLKSGTPVEVLSVSKGYARVRTQDGTKGWILERYLSKEPVARERLAAVQERLAGLEDELATLRSQTATLQGLRARLEERNAALEQENRRLQSELQTLRQQAAEPLRLSEENRALKARLAETGERLGQLESQVRALRTEAERKWFLVGAGVALVSLLFGLIIPRIPWRRRRGWSEY